MRINTLFYYFVLIVQLTSWLTLHAKKILFSRRILHNSSLNLGCQQFWFCVDTVKLLIVTKKKKTNEMCGPERLLVNKITNMNTGYLQNKLRLCHSKAFAITEPSLPWALRNRSWPLEFQVCCSESSTLDLLMKEYIFFFLHLFFLPFNISKEPVSLCSRTRCEFHFSHNR